MAISFTCAAAAACSSPSIETVCHSFSALSLQPFYAQLAQNGIDVDLFSQHVLQESHEVQMLLRTLFNSISSTSSISVTHETDSDALNSSQKLLFRNHLTERARRGNFQQMSITFTANSRILFNCTLSLMSVAALLNDVELLQTLLQLGCSPNEPDNQGYTACHMLAIVTNSNALHFLYEAKADFEAKTNEGLSVYDILKARGFGKLPSVACTVFGKEVASDKVGDVIGRPYLHENVYTSDSMMMVWRYCLTSSAVSSTNKFFKHVFEQWLKKPITAPVSVHKIEANHPLHGQLELKASKTIMPGELIFEYTGLVVQSPYANTANSHVLFDDLCVDPTNKGSFGGLANHGTPNAYGISFTHGGLPHLVYGAVKKIENGEPIQINYGSAFFVQNQAPCYELNPAPIDQFIECTSGLTTFCYAVDEKCEKQYVLKNKIVTLVTKALSESYELARFKPEYVRYTCEYLFHFSNHLIGLVIRKTLSKKTLVNFFSFCSKGNLFEFSAEDQRRYSDLTKALAKIKGS